MLRLLNPQFSGGGPPRKRLNALLASDGATVANYQSGTGITGTLNASAWANQIGSAPSLTAAGAAQPIVLSYTPNNNYVYLPAVASNTVTSPNKTITGSKTITFDIALNDYTPAADVTLFSKTSGNDGFSIKWLTTDKVRIVIGDGASLTNVDVVAASGFIDGTEHTVTIAWADGVGATFSYDGVQSGSQVAAAKTLTNAAVVMTIGSTTSIGKIYAFVIGGVYTMHPDDSAETGTNGATFVSTVTGETWTLNNSGAVPAQIVGSPSLLFNGTAHYMVTSAITLNWPVTAYIVGYPITWTNLDTIIDGIGGTDTMTLQEQAVSSQLVVGGSTAGFTAANFTVGAFGVYTAVWNGASSLGNLNGGSDVTGTATTATQPGGINLGSRSFPDRYANIKIKELVVRNVADSAGKRAQIQTLLKEIYGTP